LSSILIVKVTNIVSVIFFFQAEDGIRDGHVTGVQTCALPIYWDSSMNPRPERAVSSARWSGFTSGTRSGTPSSMRWDDELLITGYPACAKRVSIEPAMSAGRPENTRSHARGGSGAWTTSAAAVGGTSPGSRQVHASA